jgi:hypothetical protein
MRVQNRYQSVIESLNKSLTSYVVMVVSQFAIFPHFNINITVSDDLLIALYFTLIGLVRNYGIRRLNNKNETKKNLLQTRIQSLFEQFQNIGIGYIVAVASQLIIFPLFDIHISFNNNLLLSVYFSIISIARGYVIRRYYVQRHSVIR